MNKKAVLAIAVLAAGFLAVLVYSTIGSKQHTVEVCITFQGRSNCRTASGPTRQEAMQTAVQNACALIASGVSETIACERTPPDRVTWK